MSTLLLIESADDALSDVVVSTLTASHHQVTRVSSGTDAIAATECQQFDLILLDLGLPDVDGFDLCRHIRSAQPACALVIVSGSDAELDVVVGLESGADDYLVKPVRPGELIARIRAHLRRQSAAHPRPEVLRVGPLVLDPAARRARLQGREIGLRAREFDVLACLASETGVAVSRSRLIAEVWGPNWSGSERNLDVTISGLRRDLDAAGAKLGTRPPEIVTLRGRGYLLQLQAS